MINLQTNATVRIPLEAHDQLGDQAVHPATFIVTPATLGTAHLGPEGHDVILTASGQLGTGTVTVPGAAGELEFTVVPPGTATSVSFTEAKAVFSRRT